MLPEKLSTTVIYILLALELPINIFLGVAIASAIPGLITVMQVSSRKEIVTVAHCPAATFDQKR